MALKELLLGKETPKEIGGSLALVDVPYFSFEGKIDTGKMIVHKELAEEIMEIFKLVANENFP